MKMSEYARDRAREMIKAGILSVKHDDEWLNVCVNGGCLVSRKIDADRWSRNRFMEQLELVIETVDCMRWR